MTDHETFLELVRIKQQAPLTLAPEHSALIVVDVQRYFARPEYAFARAIEHIVPGATRAYFERVRSTVLPSIQDLQAAFRSMGLPVIFLAAGSNTEDGRDLPTWMKEFDEVALSLIGERVCPPVNHVSWQIEDSVGPANGELVLNKASSGPLNSTKLDQILCNMGVSSLVVCGLTTAVCVTQTAREFADRGFRVAIADDACTEMSQQAHEAALLTFAYVFGTVRPSSQIVEFFTGVGARREPRYAVSHTTYAGIPPSLS